MKVRVKAKSGLVCRLTELLCVSDSEKGEMVEKNSMVRRRLKDGSLEEVKPKDSASPVKSKSK